MQLEFPGSDVAQFVDKGYRLRETTLLDMFSPEPRSAHLARAVRGCATSALSRRYRYQPSVSVR